MDAIEALTTRRSCRSFKQEQIKNEELQMILACGLNAPSGKNKQSSKIVVVQNQEEIKELSKLNAIIFGKDVDPFYGAPTVIVVLADKTKMTYIEDASLVLGNLMNAAHSLGIGSCWIHRAKEEFETEEGKELLKEWNISDNYVGIGHCILGYIEGNLSVPKPRKEDYVTIIK